MARAHRQQAANRPCVSCPWRVENQGKPHPDGWFTKANRTRLWAKLKRGDQMSCHRTDPSNPVPEGGRVVPEGTTPVECAGALILQQRELMQLQAVGDIRAYRRARPKGLTVEGIRVLLHRAMFGGVPMVGGVPMAKPDLREPVAMDGLEWDPSVCDTVRERIEGAS